MYDWNDLRYLIAVARHGSTLAAGRALGLDQSTVQRRLTELERRFGQALVQRHPTGYRLTEFGQSMLPHAERVEAAVTLLRQHLATAAAEVAGIIRVTCPEPIVFRITRSTLLERFRARHPALQVHFVMSIPRPWRAAAFAKKRSALQGERQRRDDRQVNGASVAAVVAAEARARA